MGQKLFAVLTSYLRGRCAHLVGAETKLTDGVKLWHTLVHEYMPNTRQRALALAQALSAYPVFGKDKSALESMLAFGQLVMQYEEASTCLGAHVSNPHMVLPTQTERATSTINQ